MTEKIFPPSAKRLEDAYAQGNMPISQELKNIIQLIGLYIIYRNLEISFRYLIFGSIFFIFLIFFGTFVQTRFNMKTLSIRNPFYIPESANLAYALFLNIIKIIIIIFGIYIYFLPKFFLILQNARYSCNIIELIYLVCNDIFLYFIIAFSILSIADVIWVRHRYYNQMYMTKEEYLQEMKDSGNHKSATKKAINAKR